MLLADALSPESQRHAIEVIARNATTQVRLVDEVLDLSRIVRGQLRLGLRPVDVRAVIHRALDTARPAAAAKELTLDVHLPEAVETIADADRLQSAQAAAKAQEKALDQELKVVRKLAELGENPPGQAVTEYRTMLRAMLESQREAANRGSEANDKRKKMVEERLKQLDALSKVSP